eukprot:6203318-Pleurochrysis_carterae.AAC.4
MEYSDTCCNMLVGARLKYKQKASKPTDVDECAFPSVSSLGQSDVLCQQRSTSSRMPTLNRPTPKTNDNQLKRET